MDNKNVLIVCIENILTIGLFVFLAIHFKHWWIVLFSLLFMTYVEHKEIKEKDNDDGEKKVKGEQ